MLRNFLLLLVWRTISARFASIYIIIISFTAVYITDITVKIIIIVVKEVSRFDRGHYKRRMNMGIDTSVLFRILFRCHRPKELILLIRHYKYYNKI